MTNRGRQLYCRRCEGHGIKNSLRGHGAICPFVDCNCRSCSRLMKMRKSAFLRRYKEILSDSDTKMAEELVSEYRLVDGTNPRLRFSKDPNGSEIATPKPVKICDFNNDLMGELNLSSPTTTITSNQQLQNKTSQPLVYLPLLNTNKVPTTFGQSQMPFMNASSMPNLNQNYNGQQSLRQTNLMNFQLQAAKEKPIIPQIGGSAFTSLPNLPSNLSNLTNFSNMPINPTQFNIPFQQMSLPYNIAFPQQNIISDPKPFLIPNNYQQSLAYFELLNSRLMNRS